MYKPNQRKRIVEETKRLVDLFLKTNYSDIEISEITGIPSSTVGRRLTDYDAICEAFPGTGEDVYAKVKEQRRQNQLFGKSKGGKTSTQNQSFYRDNSGHFLKTNELDLNIFSSIKIEQIKILLHLLLTFRLNLKTLANLFKMNELELLDEFIKLKGLNYMPLTNLIYNEDINDVASKEKLLKFYFAYLQSQDDKEKKALLSVVTDVIPIMMDHEEESIDSPLFLLAVLIYQLKYTLSNETIAKTFKFDNSYYEKLLKDYFNSPKDNNNLYEKMIFTYVDSKDKLKERYEDLMKSYQNTKLGGR